MTRARLSAKRPDVRPHWSAIPTVREYLGVSLYWFALSLFWGAMLTMVLPHRVEQLVGVENKDKWLPLVVGSGAAIAAITQIMSGALSDVVGFRIGRRRPYLIVGTLLVTPALLLFAGAADLARLISAYIAIQFLLNIAIGPYQSLIPDIIPLAFHGRASAYMGVWTLLGRIGGPVLALVLTRGGDLLALMVVFAILLNVFMVVNVALVREEPAKRSQKSVGETIRGLFDVPLRPYPSFVWIMISRFGIMMGVYTVTYCLFYYVEHTLGARTEEASKSQIARFMILATVTGLIGTIPAGKLGDKLPKKTVLYVSNSICVVAAIGFLLAKTFPAAYFAVAVFGLGFGAFQAVDWALGCNLLPEHARAKYLGVWGLSDTVPQVIAPFAAGPIAYAFNTGRTDGPGYRVLMLMSILYFTLGTFALKNIRERRTEDKA